MFSCIQSTGLTGRSDFAATIQSYHEKVKCQENSCKVYKDYRGQNSGYSDCSVQTVMIITENYCANLYFFDYSKFNDYGPIGTRFVISIIGVVHFRLTNCEKMVELKHGI